MDLRLTEKKVSNQNSDQNGYALLYTIIIISVAVGLSSIILSSQTRQVQLTTTANQSTEAFYAADTGLECALYHDRQGAFSASQSSLPSEIDCAGEQASLSKTEVSCVSGNLTEVCLSPLYRYSFSLEENTCANVQIDKRLGSGSVPTTTTIVSSGLDNCQNPEVERVLRSSY